jgi:hypothetical protein
MPKESEVKSCEHQNNADIRCEPFPELVSEETEIYTDYDGYHRRQIKANSYLSAHFSRNRHFGFLHHAIINPMLAAEHGHSGRGVKRQNLAALDGEISNCNSAQN